MRTPTAPSDTAGALLVAITVLALAATLLAQAVMAVTR